MENNERDRKLDRWLDKALSEYSAAEPRFGLEQRVLNRIRGEEQHSRKWNFWRWVPAFGAIAAVVVVAVAIRPMLEKKTPVQQSNSRLDTYSRPSEEKLNTASTGSLPQTAAVPATKLPKQPDLNDTSRGTPAARRELAIVPQKGVVPQRGDRDRLISQDARLDNQLRAMRSHDKKEAASDSESAMLSISAGVPAPGPPPPPPATQGQPGVVGGIVANVPPTAAKAAPAGIKDNELKASAQNLEVQSGAPALLNDMVATESLTAVIAKDAPRKEPYGKPVMTRPDPNVIEVFGVKVRFQTAPATPTQQFPTPVPLSKQEKLALSAAWELKDTAGSQHKAVDIKPIEIKDVEIKPLEGPQKEK